MFIELTRLLPGKKKKRLKLDTDSVQWYQETDEELLVAEGFQPGQRPGTSILCDNGPEIFVEEDFDFISEAIDSAEKKE